MMKSVVFFLLFVVCAVFASSPEYDEGVAVLTNDNFDEWVNAQSVSLIEFYAPWCGHCKKLAPEYVKAAAALKGKVSLAKVDCTIETALQSRFGVSGYPTLKIFRNGNPSEYKGPRDADGIISFMNKQATPSITSLKSTSEIEKFVADEAAIVYFGEPAGDLYKTFEKIAGAQRESFRFAQVDAATAAAADHKDQIVILQSKRYTQSPIETAKVIASANTDSEILKWIQSNILPFVGEITADNSVLYKAVAKPLVKIYYDIDWVRDPKGANYYLNKVRKAAKEYKDKFVFAVASKTKNQKELDDSGLKGAEYFSIFNEAGHKFPGLEKFSPSSLKQHLDDFIANKLEPYVKSEPIPEQKADEATVVVGKTFEQIVNDPTKDVLLEAYAPWCGHCKSLEPKYNELAKKMKGLSENVVIAKIDATANDLPSNFNVRGFPTIFWIPANKKGSPQAYEGGREVDDFVKYIKKHTTQSIAKGKKDTSKTEL